MRFRTPTCFAVALVATFAAFGSSSASDTISQDDRAFFEERIRPVLVNHCYECHSHESGSPDAEYALDTQEGILAGGASGEPAILPGDPDGSRLLNALRYEGDLQMPPGGQLPGNVIADFEQWIKIGVPDPRSEDPDALRARANAEMAKKLWSLQPPAQPDLPAVTSAHWPRTDVDRFVLARLEDAGLTPVADADPGKLIRRVYFDLIGLPPAPEVVEQFAAAPTQEAFTKVVDQLLNSPRFGERWGRHWLDVARYAESSGMEFNFTYPHAWPYRDYVIDSFNEDKPYDRFVTEQLAGDLLPAESWQQRDEQRLGTGFLAVGPKRHNAGTTDFRMEMTDDQIRTTTEAFLALTVGCARCHDHKFDPVPTEDYYALAGIFLSTDTLYGTTKIKYSRHPTEKIAFGPDAEQRHAEYEAYQAKLKEFENTLNEKQGQLKKLEGDEKKAAEAEVAALKEQIDKLKSETPEPPTYAMGAAEGTPVDTHVAIGGDPRNKGETVPRGFLSAVSVPDAEPLDSDLSGRLQLARWIASEENPLTTRVYVNRVWHHLFGRGLVASVNNFGVLGDAPSHPELLDYLALRFVDDGWSTKKLIRSLVLSRVYQLSTRKDADDFRADPENVLLWRMTPRRLEVEPLRDAVHAVSGQLDVSRPAGSTVTALGQQLARGVSYEKLNPESYRRTVYQPVVRHYTSHMHQEFDFAASSLVVGDRAETTTSQQALFFLNSEFVRQQAEATARLLRDQAPGDTTAQVQLAYQRTLSRNATPAELAMVDNFLQAAGAALKEDYPDTQQRQTMALSSFIQTLFGGAEFRYLIHSPNTKPAETRVAAN